MEGNEDTEGANENLYLALNLERYPLPGLPSIDVLKNFDAFYGVDGYNAEEDNEGGWNIRYIFFNRVFKR